MDDENFFKTINKAKKVYESASSSQKPAAVAFAKLAYRKCRNYANTTWCPTLYIDYLFELIPCLRL